MKKSQSKIVLHVAILVITWSLGAVAQSGHKDCGARATPREGAHSVIIFVADGLRHDAVTPETAPTMFQLRQQGVDFLNSHSLFPTLTTPNASAFATGHQLGDTGDFGNALFVGRPVPEQNGSLTPFLEDDLVLATVNGYYSNNQPKSYIGLETLLDRARSEGYAAAAVGKQGPTAIQDINEIQIKVQRLLDDTCSIVIDDQTNIQVNPAGDTKAAYIPLPGQLVKDIAHADLGYSGSENDWSVKVPSRNNGESDDSPRHNGNAGTNAIPGTIAANVVQQQFFADVTTRAILPVFEHRPFLLVFWSRDPDGTQHNQGDSLNHLRPGINGPTSHAAIRNADNNLAQIIGYLKAHDLYAKTDIIIVADHGFSTISKREIDNKGNPTASFAAKNSYPDVEKGFLPPGFLAIDLANKLHKPLFDPDQVDNDESGKKKYKQVDFSDPQRSQHPVRGNGVIGGSGVIPTKEPAENDTPEIIVAANGGGDLLYLLYKDLSRRIERAKEISAFLLQQDYTDGVFVHCKELGKVEGALCLEDIGLSGTSKMPTPDIVVNFKTFSMDNQTPQLQRLTRVEIADTNLQEGQGMHGSFSRADTFNNMIAFGPDFKEAYVDHAPASNADIAVTIACALKWKSCGTSEGHLQGRVLKEALKGGPDHIDPHYDLIVPKQSFGDVRTVLHVQKISEGGRDYMYYDEACVVKGSGLLTCQ